MAEEMGFGLAQIEDVDPSEVKAMAIKLCREAGHDPYSPTSDIYCPDDPDCIYPFAGWRHEARKRLENAKSPARQSED